MLRRANFKHQGSKWTSNVSGKNKLTLTLETKGAIKIESIQVAKDKQTKSYVRSRTRQSRNIQVIVRKMRLATYQAQLVWLSLLQSKGVVAVKSNMVTEDKEAKCLVEVAKADPANYK